MKSKLLARPVRKIDDAPELRGEIECSGQIKFDFT
jgi:hypothetical protein